jgi:hypothetical protein
MTVRDLKEALGKFPDDIQIYPVEVIKIEACSSPCSSCALSEWSKAACCGCEEYFTWRKQERSKQK